MLKMATLFLCLKDLLVVEVTEISIIKIHIRVSLIKKSPSRMTLCNFHILTQTLQFFFTFNFFYKILNFNLKKIISFCYYFIRWETKYTDYTTYPGYTQLYHYISKVRQTHNL